MNFDDSEEASPSHSSRSSSSTTTDDDDDQGGALSLPGTATPPPRSNRAIPTSSSVPPPSLKEEEEVDNVNNVAAVERPLAAAAAAAPHPALPPLSFATIHSSSNSNRTPQVVGSMKAANDFDDDDDEEEEDDAEQQQEEEVFTARRRSSPSGGGVPQQPRDRSPSSSSSSSSFEESNREEEDAAEEESRPKKKDEDLLSPPQEAQGKVEPDTDDSTEEDQPPQSQQEEDEEGLRSEEDVVEFDQDDEEPLDGGHDDDVDEDDVDAPAVVIPSWAQGLTRPETSASVGRFSYRSDEFTRNLNRARDDREQERGTKEDEDEDQDVVRLQEDHSSSEEEEEDDDYEDHHANGSRGVAHRPPSSYQQRGQGNGQPLHPDFDDDDDDDEEDDDGDSTTDLEQQNEELLVQAAEEGESHEAPLLFAAAAAEAAGGTPKQQQFHRRSSRESGHQHSPNDDDDSDRGADDRFASSSYSASAARRRDPRAGVEDLSVHQLDPTRRNHNDEEGVAAGVEAEEEEEAFPISDANEWDEYLHTGLLVDSTPFTECFLIKDLMELEEEEEEAAAAAGGTQTRGAPREVLSLFKRFSPPIPEEAIATDLDRVSSVAQTICVRLLEAAKRITEDEEIANNVLLPITEVTLDTHSRIIVAERFAAQAVSLADAMAYATLTAPLIRTVLFETVANLALLHGRGLVHGALHAGNVMICGADGKVRFTGGCGLLPCPALSPDPGFLSPNLAVQLRDVLPSASQVSITKEPMTYLKEVWQSLTEDAPLRLSPSDDLYAVAQLLVGLIHGFPSHFGSSLPMAVEAIASGGWRIDLVSFDTAVDDSLLYQRAVEGMMGADFFQEAQSFVTALLARPHNASQRAQELLLHPFFATLANDTPAEDIAVQLSELASDTQNTMLYCATHIGSSPFPSRLLRNAVFARRRDSLRETITKASHDAQPLIGCLSLARTAKPSLVGGVQEELEQEEEEDASILDEVFTVIGDRILLIEGSGFNVTFPRNHRLFAKHNMRCEDTLILIRNVSGASLTLLGAFHTIVLENVVDSTITLGACRTVYLHNVHRCPLIAVLACTSLLSHATDVVFAYHGVDPPLCPDPNSVRHLKVIPYNVAYPGLSEDARTLGIALESTASLMEYEGNGHGDAADDEPPTSYPREPLQLLPPQATGFDYPFLTSLPSHAKKFVHAYSSSDLYIRPGELPQYHVVLHSLHGGPETTSSSQRHQGSTPNTKHKKSHDDDDEEEEGSADDLTPLRYPVLFLCDTLESVYISDCSYVTIVVMGAKTSVRVRDVSHAKLFLCGAEVMLTGCRHCEVYGYAWRGALIDNCQRLQVMPLALCAPGVDEVFGSLLGDALSPPPSPTTSFSDPIHSMNVFAGRLELFENKEVAVTARPQYLFQLVDHEAWAQHPRKGGESSASSSTANSPVKTTTSSSSVGTTKNDEDGIPFVSRFFLREVAWDGKQITLMPLDVRAAITQFIKLKSYEHADRSGRPVMTASTRTTVAIHHRFDISGLYLPSTLCPLREPETPTESSCDVHLYDVDCGVLHIADSIGTLTIEHCSGPLEIACVAAENVHLKHCRNVTLQVACFRIELSDCVNCHAALHCNSQPVIDVDCRNISLSALNVSALEQEDLMIRSSVSLDLNLFDKPRLLKGANTSLSRASTSDVDTITADSHQEMLPEQHQQGHHAVLAKKTWASYLSVAAASTTVTAADVASPIAALKLLDRQCFVVPPLAPVCLGPTEAPFLEVIEDRVQREEARPQRHIATIAALNCLAVASVEDLALCVAGGDAGGAPPSPFKKSTSSLAAAAAAVDSPQSDASGGRPPRPHARLSRSHSQDKYGLANGMDDDEDDEEEENYNSSADEEDDGDDDDDGGAVDEEIRDSKQDEEVQDVEKEESNSSSKVSTPSKHETATATKMSTMRPPSSSSSSSSDDQSSESEDDDCAYATRGNAKITTTAQQPSTSAPVVPMLALRRGTMQDDEEEELEVFDKKEDNTKKSSDVLTPKKDAATDDDDEHSGEDTEQPNRSSDSPVRPAPRHAPHPLAVGVSALPGSSQARSGVPPLPFPTVTAERTSTFLTAASSPSPPRSAAPRDEVEEDEFTTIAASGEVGDDDGATTPQISSSSSPRKSSRPRDGVILFLDVDGVLVPVSPMCFGGGEIETSCVRCLRAIVDACGGADRVTIVVSSTWRLDPAKMERLNQTFRSFGGIPETSLGVSDGVPNPTPLTSVTYYKKNPSERKLVCERVDEILYWLEQNAEGFPEGFHGGRWLAIDDMDLGVDPRMTTTTSAADVEGRCVTVKHALKTDIEEGLLSIDVDRACELIAALPSPSPPPPPPPAVDEAASSPGGSSPTEVESSAGAPPQQRANVGSSGCGFDDTSSDEEDATNKRKQQPPSRAAAAAAMGISLPSAASNGTSSSQRGGGGSRIVESLAVARDSLAPPSERNEEDDEDSDEEEAPSVLRGMRLARTAAAEAPPPTTTATPSQQGGVADQRRAMKSEFDDDTTSSSSSSSSKSQNDDDDDAPLDLDDEDMVVEGDANEVSHEDEAPPLPTTTPVVVSQGAAQDDVQPAAFTAPSSLVSPPRAAVADDAFQVPSVPPPAYVSSLRKILATTTSTTTSSTSSNSPSTTLSERLASNDVLRQRRAALQAQLLLHSPRSSSSQKTQHMDAAQQNLSESSKQQQQEFLDRVSARVSRAIAALTKERRDR